MAVRSESLSTDAEANSVGDARALIEQHRWWDAYQVLSRLDGRSALGAQDLEDLAVCAFLCGKGMESRQARLRAYQIHLNGGDRRAAALCAMRIGFGQISTGELAQASGCLPASLTSCAAWVAHAASLLTDGDEGVEQGYLLIPVAYEQLVMGGDLDAAAADSARAVEIARGWGDQDLLVLGLTIQGRAMVRSGSIGNGVVYLDEAVMVVEAGDVSPSFAGIALGSAIEAAWEVLDLDRFGDWTEALRRWCELQDGMILFQSRSLGYRAILDELRGRWDDALDSAESACAVEIGDADPAAAASAHYRQGELLRLRGQFEQAELAFREASRRGLDPQPGLALLHLARGDVEGAAASISRSLGETRKPLRRAAMLPACVEIMLAAGNLSAASEAAHELGATVDGFSTPFVEAAAHHARGAVLLAEGDPNGALGGLRVALRVWAHLDLPYEEARTRLVIAQCCRMLGDDDGSSLELSIARGILSDLGARPEVNKVDSLLATHPPSPHRLTKRELEVLRLVAQGMTNKEIAEELFVAPRTVDSHVSNIFTKLGVATRSAATALAHREDLL